MATTVTLAGSEVPYAPGTLSITSDYGARTTASLALVDEADAVDYMALMGAEVFFEDEDGVAFAGILTEPEWGVILGTTAVEWKLGFVDFSALADRVRVFDYYEAASTPLTSDIVEAIITDYLAQFGVTAGTIESGSSVSEVTYNGQTAAQALDELASRDGYAWRIDDDKRLHYQALSSYAAPWHISPTTGAYMSMEGKGSLSSYLNRVYQRGPASGISDSRTESFLGDGVRREFKLLYKANSNVSVKVNDVSKTLGIKGLESGKDFYWKQGDDIIQQDEAGMLLTSGDTLAVTYRGQVSMFVELEDAAGIASHGPYEGLFEDSSALYLNLNVQAAETHLRQNPFSKVDLSYVTEVPGLRAGMVQSISGVRNVDDRFFITSVQANDIGAFDGRLRYTVSLINGERAEDWVDWFRKIAGIKDYSVRDNEIVSRCVKLGATMLVGSSASYITKPAGKWDDGTSKWDGGVAWW